MSSDRPTAIIADDEAALRRHLKRQLARLWPELTILGEARNGLEALQAIKTGTPDLAFLDIRMPGLNGMEVAQQLGNKCHLVFVTAYDQYAVEAFESKAVDYLLKPVNDERLAITIERLKSRLESTPPDLTTLLEQLAQALSQPPQYLKWLKVSYLDETVQMISVKAVDYFQAADKYTSVFSNGDERIIRMPLKKLELALDPDHFWRIHRSIIVRVAAIKRVTRSISGRYSVEIEGYARPLPVSRNHAHLFKPT